MVTSAPSNPITSSLKATSNTIGEAFVLSVWAAPCSTVTVGTVRSTSTVLSTDVDASLALPAGSLAAPAATSRVTSPSAGMSVISTVYVDPEPPTTAPVLVAPDDPVTVRSAASKPATFSENTTSNSTDAPFAGSSWAAACSTVTVGAVRSTVTVGSVDGLVTLALPARSAAAPSAMLAVRSPSALMPLTVIV